MTGTTNTSTKSTDSASTASSSSTTTTATTASASGSSAQNTSDAHLQKEIKLLNKKRGTVKGRLTYFNKYVSNLEGSELTASLRAELKLRIQGASSLYTEYLDIQNQLDEIVPDSELLSQLEARESFENTYYGVLARAQCMTQDEEVIVDSSKLQQISNRSCVQLPTITLPTFDGCYEHWLEFRDNFTSLVHKNSSIDNFGKLHYLKRSLTGDAKQVIDSIEVSASNYTIAWELLHNRYDNSRLLVQTHVKSLFSLKTLTKESPELIRKFIDTLLKNLRALKVLGEPTDQWDTLIIYLAVSKLDSTTEREWEQHKSRSMSQDDSNPKLKVDDLLQFLRGRADMLETLNLNHTQSTSGAQKKPTLSHNTPKIHCNVATHDKPAANKSNPKVGNRLCVVCHKNHPIYSCQVFIDYSFQDRLKVVRANKLCENCLRPGHTSYDCRYGPCKRCDKKHNSLLHQDEQINNRAPPSIPATDKPANELNAVRNESSIHNHNTQVYSTQLGTNAADGLQDARPMTLQPVLLSTALVEIPDSFGIYHKARAILDNGSERSFITQSLCDKLNPKVIQSTQQIHGVGGVVTQSTQTCEIELKSLTSTFIARTQCFILPRITSSIPTVTMQLDDFCLPENIQLADPTFYESRPIDLLLGVDVFYDLLTEGKMRLPSGPFLYCTTLGWIVSGPIHTPAQRTKNMQCYFTQSMDTMQSIDTQLRKFWEIEEPPMDRKDSDSLSMEQQACEDHFVQTTKRLDDGRFCVKIPFKQSPNTLGDTYSQAEQRFLGLEKRLQRDPKYKEMYTDFIKEYHNLGHMSRVYTFNKPNYFMPHHGVLRSQATSTKLRVVYDASSPSSTGVSLNALQLVGPPIQGDLLAILLRFRENRYVACADIEKMYRQVVVDESQRDLQLILWRDNPSDALEIYQLNTVTYGTASAPFLSCRCLKQLAQECSDVEVANAINEHFYVDDFIYGSQDATTLKDVCAKVTEVLRSGCFPLRKWVFNFDTTPSGAFKELSLGENAQNKTLGLRWYYERDELFYQSEITEDFSELTKRIILSNASKIYDPLGLLSPFITIAKTLLQKLWLLGLHWDESVPSDVTQIWSRFVKSLAVLKDIRIPRFVMCNDPVRVELHIFTDASQVAFGGCAYIRSIDESSAVTVRLLCSKGKVASIKPVSIPRLELSGALVGAQLYAKVIKSLRSNIDEVVFWTDSTIVLGWLRMPTNLLKTFVQNRVAQIRELTKESSASWHHVSGKDNPADLVSRGANLDALLISNLWWEGPSFLHDPDFSKPRMNCTLIPDNELLPEVKLNTVQTLTTQQTEAELFPFVRFSQFKRMHRACAYVQRFIHNAQNKTDRRVGPLSVDELRNALLQLVRFSQVESFPDVFESITKQGAVKHTHNLSKLSPFIDNKGLIRVGGRIEYSQQFSFDKKHPLLLSCKHRFTLLLFRHTHRELMHAAPQLLLFTLRETWWPVGGRNLARRLVHECVTCVRQQGKTLTPLMGNLPEARLDPGFPFLRCGVDYAGPVLILNRRGRGAKTVKCYICLFICFSTRAVHLELVSDLSTEAYLLTLKRFISRRGKPAVIYSDNGKNFVGLMNEFSKFLDNCSDEIKEYVASQSIEFKMIPPYASHFGGFWEAGIRSCKQCLRRVVGDTHLTFEEFSTVLAQVESILNSRPLSPMSTDPKDLNPLTPAHFLVGRPLTAPVSADLQDVPANRLTRYQRVEQIRQHFWARWSIEYVSELQQRGKWRDNTEDLRQDTLVLIKDNNMPPMKWSMGRIERTFPGKDGINRVADIRTSTGITRRAFSKICPLTLTND